MSRDAVKYIKLLQGPQPAPPLVDLPPLTSLRRSPTTLNITIAASGNGGGYTSLTGLSLKTQETALLARPDIVIATPGRLIDHIQNTPTFTLSALDILVFGEADRMLSDGFADELQEIIRSCPENRQIMLFSATMTDDVDSLVRLSMNRPVRLFVDPKKTVAKALVQEFVRIRKGSDRQAFLATLRKRTAKRSTIIFFRRNVLCHQMKVVFGLLGFKAAEIHGNPSLTQEQAQSSGQSRRQINKFGQQVTCVGTFLATKFSTQTSLHTRAWASNAMYASALYELTAILSRLIVDTSATWNASKPG